MFEIVIIISLFLGLIHADIVCNPKPGSPPNDPFGNALGIKPGRVSWAMDKTATHWDGTDDAFWWAEKNLELEKVKVLLKKVILNVADEENGDLKTAWDKIFRHFNKRVHGKDVGYTKGESIVSKMNLNGNFFTYDSNQGNQVSPQFLVALIDQFVNVVGVEQSDIYFYDASRMVTENFYEGPQGVGNFFPNVQFYDNQGGKPYVKKVYPDYNSYLEFSNSSVPARTLTKIPHIVQNASYMIEINDFRGHNGAGFTGSGKNWFGSIYRPDVNCTWPDKTPPPHYNAGHWCPKSLHPFVATPAMPMGVYDCLVDLLGHPKLGQNVLIWLMDGMYGGKEETNKTVPYFSVSRPIKFAMSPFDNWWTSSVFAALDPIAIDSVQFDFIRNEPNIPYGRSLGCVDNYLHETSKIPNPPSGVKYNPTGKSPLKESLGVHEHWNNEKEKKYTRNLGTGNGIELCQLF